MDSTEHYVFVYGTLKTNFHNNYLMKMKENGSCRFIGNAATAEKWPLVVLTSFNLPFLLNAKEKGDNVKGEVYKIDDCMLGFLDDFEDHPHLYQRQQIKVVIDSNAIVKESNQIVDGDFPSHCWCYMFNNYNQEHLDKPSFKEYCSYDYNPEECSSGEDVFCQLGLPYPY